jgi:cell division protein FtsZ
MNEEDTLKFDIPTDAPRIIKVIGVGGGGGNAVQNMYREGIHNVSFVVCNTDSQALANSPIPSKVQLGEKVTEGLGAGNDPEVGREAAEESRAKIESLFNDGTKMVFITAGMGGGTGTGAAPVVAEIAKGLNILTIGIVTIPFKFEMGNKIHQALKGVTEISKHVDALLVINNQRLLDIYPELTIDDGLCKVDEVLTTATKSIAEIITARGTINLDFRDVSRVLKNGGVAIMSYGIEKGEQRLALAFEKALHSPLLNNNDIYKSKKILFNIYYNPNHPLKIGEIEEVNSFMAQFTEEEIEVIWGISKDYSLEDGAVKVTVLATGFSMHNIPEMQPLLNEEEREREMQEEKIKSMKDAFYKEDFKIYIFDDSELDNESLISAVESLPTHKRMAKDMQQIKNISSEAKKAYEPEYEQASGENVTINMDPEENPANDNSVEISY